WMRCRCWAHHCQSAQCRSFPNCRAIAFCQRDAFSWTVAFFARKDVNGDNNSNPYPPTRPRIVFGATVTIMMNPMENSKAQADASRAARKKGFGVIISLLPYIWMFKWRVVAALACLVAAKVASVMLPVYLKDIVDQLSLPRTALVLPVAAL